MRQSLTLPHPITILIADDDEDDVRLVERTLRNERVLNTLHHVRDGVEALEYLRQQGDYAEARRPDLILLDLNMPRKGGDEVLEEMRNDPKLMGVPVAVFTTSDDERDEANAKKYAATSFITKPLDLAKIRQMMRDIGSYWFCIVALPDVDFQR